MTEDLVLRWLRLAAARVAEARERLTELDAAIGDGDHGINLDRGFREVVRRLDDGALPAEPQSALLVAVGRTIMGTVGGASGALYGRAFQRAGSALELPAGGEPPAPAECAAVALEVAVAAIAALGRATVGEKTMLDALVPARDACLLARRNGASLAVGTAQAAAAAEDGAARTIPLLATKGRASYLGERSIGHLDPGAVSSAILLRALADAAADR